MKEKLRAFDYACGAVKRCEPSFGVLLSLWQEHGTFHVRAHDFNTHKRIFWDSFPTLTAARKRFNKAKQELSN